MHQQHMGKYLESVRAVTCEVNMEHICKQCKEEIKGKSFTYASFSKTVKILICEDCHRKNLQDMNTASKNILGKNFELGVLKNGEN